MTAQVWWYVARATGIVAWALLSLAVIWGLLLSTSMLKGWSKPKWLLDLHRFLGGLAVVFTAFHLISLMADSYISFGFTDLLVPLASSWKPWPVAAGVVAMYLLVAVEVTSLLMSRIPRRYWRWVHLTSFGSFWMASFHSVTAGTDAGHPILWWANWVTSAAVLFLTLYRILADAEARRPARRKARIAAAAAAAGQSPA